MNLKEQITLVRRAADNHFDYLQKIFEKERSDRVSPILDGALHVREEARRLERWHNND